MLCKLCTICKSYPLGRTELRTSFQGPYNIKSQGNNGNSFPNKITVQIYRFLSNFYIKLVLFYGNKYFSSRVQMSIKSSVEKSTESDMFLGSSQHPCAYVYKTDFIYLAQQTQRGVAYFCKYILPKINMFKTILLYSKKSISRYPVNKIKKDLLSRHIGKYIFGIL